MNHSSQHIPDPALDLVLERYVDVSAELVWKAWTDPELLKQWFCPRPWQTTECEIDLRPGGAFRTVMCGPDGQQFDSTGCYLEVIDGKRLVFTSAMTPGFRPLTAAALSAPGMIAFTAVITIEDLGGRTKYTAVAIHGDDEACNSHAAMGFHGGWATALRQLVELFGGSILESE